MCILVFPDNCAYVHAADEELPERCSEWDACGSAAAAKQGESNEGYARAYEFTKKTSELQLTPVRNWAYHVKKLIDFILVFARYFPFYFPFYFSFYFSFRYRFTRHRRYT